MSSFSCSVHNPIVTYIPSLALGASGGLFAGFTGGLWVAATRCAGPKDYITPSFLSVFPGAMSLLLLGTGVYVAGNAPYSQSRLRRFANLAISGCGMLGSVAATAYFVSQTVNGFFTAKCQPIEEFNKLLGLLCWSSSAAGATLANLVHLGVASYLCCEAGCRKPEADHEAQVVYAML